jgi:hypothetical protein
MEQLHDLTASRIDASEIRSFMKIASVTGQGQVRRVVAPAMLDGNYVLDVKRSWRWRFRADDSIHTGKPARRRTDCLVLKFIRR